jgi:hypothetical protein
MMGRFLTASLFTVAVLVGTPALAPAQGWTLDAYGGQATYEALSAEIATPNAVLGLRYAGASGGWFFLSAGAPLAAESPFWAASGLGRRLSLGPGRLSAGIDVSAYGHGYRDPTSETVGTGGSLEALPFVALAGGPARLELRSGLLQYANTFAGQSRSRTLHESGARLILRVAEPITLGAEGRYARADEGVYPYAGASLAVDLGRGQIWGSMGRWFSDALEDVAWSTGVTLRLRQRTDVWGAISQQSSDPLYWNDSRRSWNVGLSRRIGRHPPAPAPLPVQFSAGGVTVRLPISEVRSAPFIGGDFSGWKPVPMTRSGEFWTVCLPLDPGIYHYAFRTAGEEWFVPESTPGRRDDGFDGFVAILVVPQR